MPYTIYCHTSPSGKKYVGQTVRGMSKRWKGHVYEATSSVVVRRCRIFAAAIRKYGADAFQHEVIEEVATREAANEAEWRWIATLNTRSPHGYNLAAGGDVREPHDETRARMRSAAREREARKTPQQRSDQAKKAAASRPPEERRANALRASHALPAEERRVRARRREESYTPEKKAEIAEALRRGHGARLPEERSEAARRGRAAMTPERRSEIAQKGNASRSPERQSAAIAASWARLTPAERSERNRKAWATRRAKAFVAASGEQT